MRINFVFFAIFSLFSKFPTDELDQGNKGRGILHARAAVFSDSCRELCMLVPLLFVQLPHIAQTLLLMNIVTPVFVLVVYCKTISLLYPTSPVQQLPGS